MGEKNIHSGHRERKRRQYLQSGIDSFADHEVLELLLYYAIPRQDTNPVAHALMDQFGSLRAVLSAPMEALTQVPGVGENTAVFLTLLWASVRRAQQSSPGNPRKTLGAQWQGEYFKEVFAGHENEAVYMLCLNERGAPIGRHRLICSGDAASASADLREILRLAIQSGASSVVLAHNHPSGLAFPSEADLTATWDIRDALERVGIRLADHIIVAEDDFVSLLDSGQL